MRASGDTRDVSSAQEPITRLDRLVRPLWAVSGLLATLAFLLGLLLGVFLPGLGLFPAVSRWLLIPCLVLDLCSLYINVAGIVRYGGPSTVPLISWGYYLVFGLFGMGGGWPWRIVALTGMTLFHVSCYVLIPEIVGRRVEHRRPGLP